METRKGITGAWGLEVFDQIYPDVSDWLLDPRQEKSPDKVYSFNDCGGVARHYAAHEWDSLPRTFTGRGFVRFGNEGYRPAWRAGRSVAGMESFAHFFEGLYAMPNPAC